MSSTSEHLEGGRFYGRVANRRDTPGVLLSEVVHPAPRALPRHAHDRTYIGLLLGGRYEDEVGSRQHTHGPLSVALLQAGVEHRDRVGNGGARFFIVEIAPDWLDAAGAGAIRPVGRGAATAADALPVTLRLYREFRQWDVGSAAVAEELTAALVAGASDGPVRDGRGRPSWLTRVEEMVRDQFRRNLALADLAREAGVHPTHLSRTFRRHFGRTPGELARALRVCWVCERIADPSRSLAELAYSGGFADQAHMTRAVARSVGISPGRLRALLRPDSAGAPAHSARSASSGFSAADRAAGADAASTPAPASTRPTAT